MSRIFNEPIDITMTATLRPNVLNDTLVGIKKYVIREYDLDLFTLILNIDCVGENVLPKEMVKIANKHFTKVKYNIAKEPSFPKAVKWVWSQSTTNFIFHIEDDWNFLRKITIPNMIKILKNNKDLSSLRLYKFNTPNSKVIRTFMCKWVFQEQYGFYLANDWKRQFGLNPILIKREFIDQALPLMVDNVNPEKQFRESQSYMRDVIKSWKYGLYTTPGSKRTVDDAGRGWARKQKYSKPRKGTFITWEKH